MPGTTQASTTAELRTLALMPAPRPTRATTRDWMPVPTLGTLAAPTGAQVTQAQVTRASVPPIQPQRGSGSARATKDARRTAPPTGRGTVSSERTLDPEEPARASTGTAASTRSRSTPPLTAPPLRRDSAPRHGVAVLRDLSSAPPPCRLASTRLAATCGATPAPRAARNYVGKRIPLMPLRATVPELRPGVYIFGRKAFPTSSARELLELLDARRREARAHLAPRTLADAPRRSLEHVSTTALPLQQLTVVLVSRGQTPSTACSGGFLQLLDRQSTPGPIPVRTDGTPMTGQNGARSGSPRVALGAPPSQGRVVVLVAVGLARPTP